MLGLTSGGSGVWRLMPSHPAAQSPRTARLLVVGVGIVIGTRLPAGTRDAGGAASPGGTGDMRGFCNGERLAFRGGRLLRRHRLWCGPLCRRPRAPLPRLTWLVLLARLTARLA